MGNRSKCGTSALTAQRYRIRRRIFDTLLKRRIYHRFGASQFSGMILICFLGERLPPRSSEVDLRADERSPSRETGFRPACRTAERPRQKQVGQAPSGNRGAARQRVHPEVHRETLQLGSLHKSDIIVRLARTLQEHLSRTRSFRIRSAFFPQKADKNYPQKLGGAKSMIYKPFQ